MCQKDFFSGPSEIEKNFEGVLNSSKNDDFFPFFKSKAIFLFERDDFRPKAGGTALPTPKRKQLSPYGETQVARALKLGKGNDFSPILRDNGKERKITIKRHNGPLSGFSTPQQTKRKPVKKIRRCLNPDNKQLLINSMFSPRADLSTRNDTISADPNGDALNLE